MHAAPWVAGGGNAAVPTTQCNAKPSRPFPPLATHWSARSIALPRLVRYMWRAISDSPSCSSRLTMLRIVCMRIAGRCNSKHSVFVKKLMRPSIDCLSSGMDAWAPKHQCGVRGAGCGHVQCTPYARRVLQCVLPAAQEHEAKLAPRSRLRSTAAVKQQIGHPNSPQWDHRAPPLL